MKLDIVLAIIHKYEIIIASIFLLFATIVLAFFLLVPNFNRAQEIYQKHNELKVRVDNLKKKDNILSTLDDEFYKNNFPKINMVLPEGKDYVSLFTTFDNLERKEGISIIKTDFQLGVVSTQSAKFAQAAGTQAFFIPITMEVIGSLPSLQNFIKSLSDYSGRFMTIDDFSWTKKEEGRLLLTLNGRAYFYPLPLTLGAIDSPLTKISQSEEKILDKISKIQLVPQEEARLGRDELGKKDLFQ